MTYFYARGCTHGLNVAWQSFDGKIDRLPGAIYRFKTRADRDAWVNADNWNKYSRWTREPVTRAQIESKIRKATEDSHSGGPWWRDSEDEPEYLTGA